MKPQRRWQGEAEGEGEGAGAGAGQGDARAHGGCDGCDGCDENVVCENVLLIQRADSFVGLSVTL